MSPANDKYQRLRNWDDEAGDVDIIPDAGRDDIEITMFDSAKATTPQPSGAISWPDFVDFCRETYGCERHRSHKLNAPAIIAGQCIGKRANANVRFLSVICADFDIGPDDPRYKPFDDMVHHMMEQDMACVIYTTTSNTQAHNRYRVIMPLSRNVAPAIWPAVWQAANAKFDGAFDAATKDPARLSFLPAKWTADTFHDARKGQVTLVNAFNDFASHDAGRPILDDAEIDACAAKAARMTSRAITPPKRPAVQKPVMHNIGDVDVDGPAVSPAVWKMLSSLNGPLVTPWMRAELPREEGSRTYRFLKSAAMRAHKQGLQINVDLLCNLAMKWLHETRNAPPPADLVRQAQNAINFAFQTQQ